MSKKSIRFFNNREVRAVWDDTNNKWWFSATDIVRAINDEDDYVKAGNYYAWGETAPKATYSWATYFDTTDGGSTFITFNNNGGLTELDAAHDPATSLDAGAATPTVAQWEELLSKCSGSWGTVNGVYGRTFTSRVEGFTDNSIFIPAAGAMSGSTILSYASAAHYWLKGLSSSTDSKANYFIFHSGAYSNGDNYRYEGKPIRAVYNP